MTTENLNIDEKPAAPAAPEAGQPPQGTQEPKVELNVDLPAVKVEPTGDAATDLALGYFAKHGIGKDSAAFKVANETGDFGPLREALAAKGATDYDGFVRLAEDARTRVVSAQANAKKAIGESVAKAVGGIENWNAIREWAAGAASAEERVQVNAGLSNPATAAMTAEWLAGKFAKAQAAQGGAQSAVKPGAARATGEGDAPLSAREFQKAIAGIVSQIGTAKLESSPEYKKLEARRKAGIKAGK